MVGNPHKPLPRKLALQRSKLGQLVAHIELEQLELVERIALVLGIELVGQRTHQLGPSRLALDRLVQLVALGPDRLEQLDKLGQLVVLVELDTLAVVELELDKPVVALELGIAMVELAALFVSLVERTIVEQQLVVG